MAYGGNINLREKIVVLGEKIRLLTHIVHNKYQRKLPGIDKQIRDDSPMTGLSHDAA
jgi:hypothetical protein